jgi:hypothetical protein
MEKMTKLLGHLARAGPSAKPLPPVVSKTVKIGHSAMVTLIDTARSRGFTAT